MPNMAAFCCCQEEVLRDLWRPCDRETASTEDIVLPRSVYDGLPTPDAVVQLNSTWRCYYWVEESTEPLTSYDTITYQDDCEDFDCDCLEDYPCLQFAGWAALFFGDVKIDQGGCTDANFVDSGELKWAGQLEQNGDCQWQRVGGLYYAVSTPANRMWAISVGLIRLGSEYRLTVAFSGSGVGPATATYVKDVGSGPAGVYTLDLALTDAALKNAGCYSMSPGTITIEEC